MLGIRLLTEGETTIPELPWNFWVCTVFLGPVAVFQVYVLEMTLGAGGANWVIPVYTGMLVIMSAVQSGIHPQLLLLLLLRPHLWTWE